MHLKLVQSKLLMKAKKKSNVYIILKFAHRILLFQTPPLLLHLRLLLLVNTMASRIAVQLPFHLPLSRASQPQIHFGGLKTKSQWNRKNLHNSPNSSSKKTIVFTISIRHQNLLLLYKNLKERGTVLHQAQSIKQKKV